MSGTISFQNVGVCFRMHRERVTTLKEAVLGRFRHLRDAEAVLGGAERVTLRGAAG